MKKKEVYISVVSHNQEDLIIDNFKNLMIWFKDLNNTNLRIIEYIKEKIMEHKKNFIVVYNVKFMWVCCRKNKLFGYKVC